MISILKMKKWKLNKIKVWPKVTQVLTVRAEIQTNYYLAPRFLLLIQWSPAPNESLFIQLVKH